MSTTTFAPSETAKPTGKQVYFALRLALGALGLEWPATRRDCSDLIAKLQEVAQPNQSGTADDCPF